MKSKMFFFADKLKILNRIMEGIFIFMMDTHSTWNGSIILFPQISSIFFPRVGLRNFNKGPLFSPTLISGTYANRPNGIPIVRWNTRHESSLLISHSHSAHFFVIMSMSLTGV